MKQMSLIEMDGFLKGKCIPSDLKVNETNAEYLVRKFGELESKLNEQREYYEGVISDGSKRIAELESNEVHEDGNQFLVVRHPGKSPVIKHCTGDLEEFLRKLIEQDPLVTIDIITHRYYGIGGQWVQDAVEYLHMMSEAGIASKESEMDGQISIVRPGACDDREIRIIIRLAMGKAITALITPENLALALTGKSDLPVELKLRNVEIKVK